MKIGVLYTVKSVLDTFPQTIVEEIGPVDFVHILDEELLSWMKEENKVTPRQEKRILAHIKKFEREQVNLIISSCSSLGDLLQKVKDETHLPILKIDQPMMEEACKIGTDITLIGTAPTTMLPSFHHLEQIAYDMGKVIHITPILVERAGEALFSNQHERFVTLLLEALKLVPKQDVVILAQASMENARQSLGYELNLPVLSSPNLFIRNLKQYLGGV